MSTEDRKCGILLHPTSLPSEYGIGDFGQGARDFIKTLSECNVGLWQVLPLGPTGYGDSPYSARSCFAGNEYLIDLRSIDGFNAPQGFCEPYATVDYEAVYCKKLPLLKKAANQYFEAHKTDKAFKTFIEENKWWLEDYTLYRALSDKLCDSRWFVWPKELKDREKSSLEKYSKELEKEINEYKTLQYLFFEQWNRLHKFANENKVQIIGDIPIFAAPDSVDVWSNRKLFKVDKQGNQKSQAGVPPDAFSSTGQLWGNPLYDWDEQKKDDYFWWRQRLEFTLKLVDIVRIDHFRGFEAYWESKIDAKTAMEGKWVKGPGMSLLKHFEGKNIIAEDLGCDLEKVRELLAKTNWPGMRVFEFGFELKDGKLNSSQEHLPHVYSKDVVAYTGTHDNETARGWFNGLGAEYKDIVRRYLQCPDDDVVWQMIRTVLQSQAKYAIFPIQDILGLDNSARMNAPSTVGKFNWSYRYNPELLQPWMKLRLKEFVTLYGRC